MNLNNKGFAVSIVLYSIAAIVLVVLLLIVSLSATDVRNTSDLSNVIKKQVSVDLARPLIVINEQLPISIIEGASHQVLGSYIATGSSTDVVCSSDIDGVVTNTSSLSVGTHILTCTAKNESGKMSSVNRKLVVYKEYTIKNLLVDGSFENEFTNYKCFKNCPVASSSMFLYGNKSFNAKPTMDILEIAVMPKVPIQIISGHKYYLRTNTNYVSYSQGDRVAMYVEGIGGVAGNTGIGWQLSSSINTATVTNSISDIRIGKCYGTSIEVWDGYFDGAMVIDLTETFGQGREPDLNWCDGHIRFFEGTTTIYK